MIPICSYAVLFFIAVENIYISNQVSMFFLFFLNIYQATVKNELLGLTIDAQESNNDSIINQCFVLNDKKQWTFECLVDNQCLFGSLIVSVIIKHTKDLLGLCLLVVLYLRWCCTKAVIVSGKWTL